MCVSACIIYKFCPPPLNSNPNFTTAIYREGEASADEMARSWGKI